MGCAGQRGQLIDDAKSSQIDRDIRKEVGSTPTTTILFLGTGGSGKSTFTRVIKSTLGIISQRELALFSDVLRTNAMQAMQTLLMCPVVQGELHDNPHFQTVMEATLLTPEVSVAIQALSDKKIVQKCFMQRYRLNLQIPDSSYYYFANSNRFAQPDFEANLTDITHASIRSTGILETLFTYNSTPFRLIDVGGQRSERRKWLSCMTDVTAVIYLVALNDYQSVLIEDNTTNRMVESLTLFKVLTNSKFLRKKEWILFLNKKDLFKEQIETTPLTVLFPDCPDEAKNSYALGRLFILEQFRSLFGGKHLSHHFTCAIDPENARRVFHDVRLSILAKCLSHVQLL